ncbi:MAG: hypothetical protein ACO29O_06470, partial [Chitinophagaceae bacterium]
DKYLRADGLTYRFVPILSNTETPVNTENAKEVMMKKFAFGNAENHGVYFDEENRRHLLGIRQAYAEAASNLAAQGKNEDAKALLQKVDKGIPDSTVPYGMVSRGNQHDYLSILIAEAAYKSGDFELGDKIVKKVRKDIEEQISYYAYLGNMSSNELANAIQEILDNKGDNLNNRQKGVFMEMRNAFGFREYLNNIERTYKSLPQNSESPTLIKNSPDSNVK